MIAGVLIGVLALMVGALLVASAELVRERDEARTLAEWWEAVAEAQVHGGAR